MRGHLAALLSCLLLTGCTGGAGPPWQSPPPAPDPVADALALLADWGGAPAEVALGRRLLAEGRIAVVPDASLPGFLGWADIGAGRVELAARRFGDGYGPRERGLVLLHELVHLRSTEQSHAGPWWSVVAVERWMQEEN